MMKIVNAYFAILLMKANNEVTVNSPTNQINLIRVDVTHNSPLLAFLE